MELENRLKSILKNFSLCHKSILHNTCQFMKCKFSRFLNLMFVTTILKGFMLIVTHSDWYKSAVPTIKDLINLIVLNKNLYS